MIKPPGLKDIDLQLVPPGMKEDALQEAWLAHMEGKSPSKAVDAYVHRERWRAEKEVNFTDAGLDD